MLKRKRGLSNVEDRETGVVKWFDNNKGYGFIIRDRGGEVYVHYSGINDKDYCALQIGGRVEFIVIMSPKGLQAQDVMCLQ
jgi:CspA family cold shock protein